MKVKPKRAEVFRWLTTFVDSCSTEKELTLAEKLCDLYVKKYPYAEIGDAYYIINGYLLVKIRRKIFIFNKNDK